MESTAADLIIRAGTVVTVNPNREILSEALIVISEGKIVAIERDLQRASQWRASRIIDAREKVVFPGLVNTHNHLFQSLLKGLGDDRVLQRWFQEVTGPAAVHLTPEDCYVAALLGCAEALRSGTTTMLDFMYPHPQPFLSDAIIQAFRETGIRGILARGFFDTGREAGVPAEILQPIDAALADCKRLIETYHGAENGRIRVWVAPCAIWGQTPEGILKAKELADCYGIGLTMHVSETPWEIENSRQRFGLRDLPFLDSLGVVDRRFLAVHGVYFDARDIDILRKRRAGVSHNTISNMYLSSGPAPVPEMIQAGVTVGLGTDGAASNNNQNMVQMLKFTALLHKAVRRDPTVITAGKVLEMATIDGARALGMEEEIGSIEVGKRADLMICDFHTLATTPSHHPVSTLVYSALGSEVCTVIVEGRVVVDEGCLVTVDEAELLSRATVQARDLAYRSGAISGIRHGGRTFPDRRADK